MAFKFVSPIKIDGVSESYERAFNNHVILGLGQGEACVRAGLGFETRKDVFQRHPIIRKELEKYMDEHPKIDQDKQELIDFYRSIINAPYNCPLSDIHIPSSLNKEIVRRSQIVEKFRPAMKGDLDPKPKLISREITLRSISESDRINAAKELSILLGLREEKSKVTMEEELIKELSTRRGQLASGKEN